MKQNEETAREARQGEIPPRKPVVKVLFISTAIAAVLLILAAIYLV